jgi:hypothetical protein
MNIEIYFLLLLPFVGAVATFIAGKQNKNLAFGLLKQSVSFYFY